MKPVNPDRLKQTVEKLVNAGAEKPQVDQVGFVGIWNLTTGC
jgi:hypothetical protein